MGFKTKAGNFIDKVFGKDIVVEVDGIAYSNFLSVSVTRSLETIANEFTVTGTVEKLEDFQISLGDDVVILFHEVSILDGYVESISSEYSNNGHTVTISGRDRTADIVDGTVFKPLVINGAMTLKVLLTKLLSENGISNINVIDLVRPDIFEKTDQIEVEKGTGLFEVVDKYCAKRQVLATTNGQGDLVITRGGVEAEEYSDKILHIANQFQSGQNNVLQASKTQASSNRYNKYIVQCQEDILSQLFKGSSLGNEILPVNEGVVFDQDIRKSRVLVIVDESLGSAELAKKRAEWEASIRKSRSFGYTCSVQGFLVDKTKVWSPNSLVHVTDERLDVDEKLLIRDVSFSYNVDNGSITQLTLVKEDSYIPKPLSPDFGELTVNNLLDDIKRVQVGGNE
jgi:prophage tail gpP-like protein